MNSSSNRKRNSPDPPVDNEVKRFKLNECQYGMQCFRKNPAHFKEFFHSHLNKLFAYQSDKNTPIDNKLKALLDQPTIKEQLDIIREHNILTAQPDNSAENKRVTEIYRNKVAPKESLASIATTDSNPTASSSKSPAVSSSPSDNNMPRRTPAKHDIHDFCPVVAPRGQFASKHENAAPFYFFYTTITDSPVTHVEPLSVTFQELLDPSLGELESSMQINFMVDIAWLMAQYIFAGYRNKPLTILYGADDSELNSIQKRIPTITPIKIKMADAFGTHHTKMMLFHYEDGSLRIVVSTANLYEDDWHNRTQGLWVSPKCPKLQNSNGSNSDDGNGPTDFKKELINYLNSYKLPVLQEWIGRVRRADFSHINVFLVTSVPGTHRASDYDKYGHAKMANLLSKHCTLPKTMGWNPPEWSIFCQCSSIGSLGPNPNSWLCGQIRNSFSRMSERMLVSLPNISVIYPSFKNVKQSHDDLLGGGCLPYNQEQHMKQTWLENYLCQWKCESRHRNKAMPHIKTYCRISPDLSRLAWFHLTSANLSKAAWGVIPNSPVDKRITIRSYEAGVLFVPKFITTEDTFRLDVGGQEISEEQAKKIFPFPYDLPLTSYNKDDRPFFMNCLRG